MAVTGDEAAIEYICGAYALPSKEVWHVWKTLGCEFNKLPTDELKRLAFFAGVLHIVDDSDSVARRRWFKQSGKRVLPVLLRYLTVPRFEAKRFLLRNLSSKDLAELHMLGGQLADDTEHVATKERFEFFPDLTNTLRRGNKKSARYIHKAEWMVERLLEDSSLSDNQLSEIYLAEFGQDRATTTDEARERGFKAIARQHA